MFTIILFLFSNEPPVNGACKLNLLLELLFGGGRKRLEVSSVDCKLKKLVE